VIVTALDWGTATDEAMRGGLEMMKAINGTTIYARWSTVQRQYKVTTATFGGTGDLKFFADYEAMRVYCEMVERKAAVELAVQILNGV
jgi:hypothetical protein